MKIDEPYNFKLHEFLIDAKAVASEKDSLNGKDLSIMNRVFSTKNHDEHKF